MHESLTLIKSQFNRNLNLAKFTLTEVTDAFSLSLSPFYGSEKPPSDPFIVEMKHWHRLHTCPFLTAKTFVLAAPRVKKNIYYHCTQLKGSMHNTIEIVWKLRLPLALSIYIFKCYFLHVWMCECSVFYSVYNLFT